MIPADENLIKKLQGKTFAETSDEDFKELMDAHMRNDPTESHGITYGPIHLEALDMIFDILDHIIPCKECGNCCKGMREILMLDTEALRIADSLGMTLDRMLSEYHIKQKLSEGQVYFTYIINGMPQCPFLCNDKCSIYDIRPLVCKTFPIHEDERNGKSDIYLANRFKCERSKEIKEMAYAINLFSFIKTKYPEECDAYMKLIESKYKIANGDKQ